MPIYVGLYKKHSYSGEQDTEVSGGSYARQEVKFDYSSDENSVYNSEDVVFPVATEHWNYVDLLKLHGDNGSVVEIPLRIPVRVQVGMQARFNPGSILIFKEDPSFASTAKWVTKEDPLTWNNLSDLAAASKFVKNRSVWERAADDEL